MKIMTNQLTFPSMTKTKMKMLWRDDLEREPITTKSLE